VIALLLLLTSLGAGAPPDPPDPGATTPVSASFSLELMLDSGGYGTIRRALSEQADTVGLWPLHEISGTLARNASEDRNHGTYSGSLTRGQEIEIPEGAIGVKLGGGWIEIPDDSALGLTNNLSLAAGGFNIRFFIKTTHNDATLRCIVQKMTTDETGDGWAIGLETGNLTAFARNSGTPLFTANSDDIADGEWHFCDFVYQPDQASALWKVDGVTSGSPVVGVTTELNPTNANVRIGAFNDGTGTHTLTTLGLVNLSRQGNTSLSPIIQAMRDWDDVSDDLRMGGFSLRYGIPGTSPTDRVASTGTLQCLLANHRNGGGEYSIGHANALGGLDLGIPVRGTISYGAFSKVYRGYLKSAKPTAGQSRTQDSLITAVDWFNVLAQTKTSRLQALTNANSWSAAALVFDEADKQPAAVSISTTSPILPFAFDNSRSESMRAMTEIQRIAQSDFSQTVMKCQDPGGVLTYEDRETIQAKQPTGTFDGNMNEFEFSHDLDSIVNSVRVSVQPRNVPGGTVVLYQAGSSITLGPNETRTVDGVYIDPNQAARRVGALTVTTPVATTDYTAFNPDNLENLTSDLVVTASLGGNAVRVSVFNSRVDSNCEVDFLRVRGVIADSDNPDAEIYEDPNGSVKKYGPCECQFDMPYQSELDVAHDAATFIVGSRSGPTVAARMRFLADRSEAFMEQALSREPGDVVEIRESQTSGSTYHNYYIQECSLEADDNGMLWCEWLLAPVITGDRFWTLGVSQLGLDTTLAWGI
jgi:hypothetical protein